MTSASTTPTHSQGMHATLMLILLTVIWGVTFPATKAALETTTPLQFLALRFGIAALIILPVMPGRIRRLSYGPSDSDRMLWLWGVLIGGLLLAGYVLQVVGLRYTTASRSGFFTGLLTLLVPIFALLFRTSRAPLTTWAALPAALLGVWLLADPAAGGLNIGDVLSIACAFVFALQMVSLEQANRKVVTPYMEPTESRRRSDVLAFAQMLVGGAGALLLALFEWERLTVSLVGWLGIAYTALFGNVFAVWMQTRFQPLVPAGHAALVFTLEPLWAALFAWLLLGDTWTARGLFGAGVIIVAMGISSFGMRRFS